MKKLLNKKGFTLMEMLIVVAIIVILVAVSVPTFTSSLGEAKKATDAANLRAAKAVATSQYMLSEAGETDASITDGYYYNPATSQFEQNPPAAYSEETEGQVIQVDITGGVVTVDWVARPAGN